MKLQLTNQGVGALAPEDPGNSRFGIIESTASQFVSAGSNNRLVRWPLTTKDAAMHYVSPVTQLWTIEKEGSRYKFKNMDNGQYMTTSANGWFWRGAEISAAGHAQLSRADPRA